MATEHGLFAYVVNLRPKDLKFIEENENKNKAKFKFQGQYARSQRWFDLDFVWIEVNFSTCETYFYRNFFQSHDNTQDTNTFKILQVLIVKSKCVENVKSQNDAPMLKYCQKSLNGCCFSSLASAFLVLKKTRIPIIHY